MPRPPARTTPSPAAVAVHPTATAGVNPSLPRPPLHPRCRDGRREPLLHPPPLPYTRPRPPARATPSPARRSRTPRAPLATGRLRPSRPRGAEAAEEREHGEDPAVVVVGVADAELGEEGAHVLLHDAGRDLEPLADALVGAALGDQLEHLALARRQGAQRPVRTVGREQLGD